MYVIKLKHSGQQIFVIYFSYMFRLSQAILRLEKHYVKTQKVIYMLLIKNWDLNLQTFG
jgi:hypothetical protein